LQYHEVKINLELEDLKNLYWAADYAAGPPIARTTNLSAVVPGDLKSASLFVDYIYLDTDERRRFAQVSHEYLIEQLQFTGEESTSTTSNKVKLNFNHPVKSLVWVTSPDTFSAPDNTYGPPQWFNYTDDWDVTGTAAAAYGATGGDVISPDDADTSAGGMPGVAAGGANRVFVPASFEGGDNPTRLAKLQLNGHDRIAEMDGRYFNLVQPIQHFENVPSKGINVYSFALQPEQHQPSGTCNLSRIDNTTLILTVSNNAVGTTTSSTVRVYATNYNVLRVMSGMGGLAYSN
jgi:hypothetical protein